MNNNLLLGVAVIGGAYWLMRRKKRNPSLRQYPALDRMAQRKRRIEQADNSRSRKEGYSTYQAREDLAMSTAAGRRRYAKTGGHKYERKA